MVNIFIVNRHNTERRREYYIISLFRDDRHDDTAVSYTQIVERESD